MGREMGRQKGKGRGGDRKGKAETDRPAAWLREQRWGTSKGNQRDRRETGHGETERSRWEWRLREQERRKSETEWERDCPGGPVVKTLRFQSRRRGFHPWLGN